MSHLLLRFGMVIGAGLAFSIIGAAWAAFWRSAAGIRLTGAFQRWERRVFGPPKPMPVEMGPDGRWRPFRYESQATKRGERIAGIALWSIAGAFAALVLFFTMTTGR